MEPHAQVKLRVKVCQGAYGQVGRQAPSSDRAAVVSALADTGAQLCLGGRDTMAKMKLEESDLLRSSISVTVANNAGLRVLGLVFATLTGRGGQKCGQLIYFAEGVDQFFLSKAACRGLGFIADDLPLDSSRVAVCDARRRSSSAPPSLTTVGLSGARQQSGILGGPIGDSGMPSNCVQLADTNDDVFGEVEVQPSRATGWSSALQQSGQPVLPPHATDWSSARQQSGQPASPPHTTGWSSARQESGKPALPPLTTAGWSSARQPLGILGGPQVAAGNKVGKCSADYSDPSPSHVQDRARPESKVDASGREIAECGCLRRTLPPSAAATPPFSLEPGNAGQVAEWLKDEYASSTFNTCEHQPLPMMSNAPPMRILMKEGATPVAIHKPAAIPAHWQAEVWRTSSVTSVWGSWRGCQVIRQLLGARGCMLWLRRVESRGGWWTSGQSMLRQNGRHTTLNLLSARPGVYRLAHGGSRVMHGTATILFRWIQGTGT